MFISLSVLVLICLIFSFAMRAETTNISDFELKRRIKLGDKRAENLLLKKQWTPGLNFILKCFSVAFIVLFVLCLSQEFSFLYVFVISGISLLAAAFLSSFKLTKRISNEIFKKVEPRIAGFYSGLSEKTKRRIARNDKQKPNQIFYSKEELTEVIKKSHNILSSSEGEWMSDIFAKSNQKISQIMKPKEALKIIHQTDFLGPLLIDELHQTGQKIFLVTDKTETKVQGILSLEKVSNLDNKTSQIAKNVMKREFETANENEESLDIFKRMILDGTNFRIINDENEELVGILELKDFFQNNKE